MNSLLLKTELSKRICSFIFICGVIFLLLHNTWKIILTDFGFEVGWSFFLFQNSSIILIFVAISTSLHIGQELCGKTVTNKIILGYDLKTIYNTHILIGILEALILFAIDTITIIIASRIKSFSCDVHIYSLVVNLIIILISIIVISIFVTMLAVIIPSRILSLVIIVGVSLVLFQRGEDLTINLIEPSQTTFFNDSQEAPPMDNPLYINGSQRTLYNLELLASPYAQVQYEKFILSEDHEQKVSTSLILKHIPYHVEFIIVGIIECLIMYYLGQRAIK